MRRLLLVLLASVIGCGANESPTNEQAGKEEPVIGPQFWLCDLSEYKQVNHDDVYGLGGRWISVRYQRKTGEATTSENMRQRFRTALLADGWTESTGPKKQPYVLSKLYERSPDDLHFSRASRGDEPPSWFFAMVVHVSRDADIVCQYCEVGW